ncbi:MAG: hypothetical protein AAFW73_27190, partial [Bacteroidota bacterium]
MIVPQTGKAKISHQSAADISFDEIEPPGMHVFLWTSQLRLHQQDSGKTRHQRYGPREKLVKSNRILAIQSRSQLPPVKKIVLIAERTYTGIDPPKIPPAETILTSMARTRTDEVSCLRFKEWTKDEEGLEFVLGIVVPPLPPNIVFGETIPKWEQVVTVRCVPADLVRDKYAVDVAIGDVYQPVDN